MRRHFLFTIFVILIAHLFIAQDIYAFNIYRVGEVIIGQEYNDVWEKWFDKKFSIWVGVSDDNTEYLLFKGETGLGDATVMVQSSKQKIEKLQKVVLKAIEWSDVAKKNKADATKSLGCFGPDKYSICEKDGTAFEENQIGLKFFSANEGKQTNLIVTLVDRDNQFIKATIYIDLPEMNKMINSIKQINTAFKKAHKTAKDQKLFK